MAVTIAISTAIVAAVGGLMLMIPRLLQPRSPFGVRVPPARVDEPVINAEALRYTKRMSVSLLAVIVALAALAVFIPAWLVLIAATLVPWAVWPVHYVSARQTVLATREQEGWYKRRQTVDATDISFYAAPPPLPWLWALPTVAVIMTTIVVGVVVYPSLPNRITIHYDLDGRDLQLTTTPALSFGVVVIQIGFAAWAAWGCWAYLRGEIGQDPPMPLAATEQERRFWGAIARSTLVFSAGGNGTFLIYALMSWGIVPVTTTWLLVSFLPVTAGLAVLLVVMARAE